MARAAAHVPGFDGHTPLLELGRPELAARVERGAAKVAHNGVAFQPDIWARQCHSGVMLLKYVTISPCNVTPGMCSLQPEAQ
jgi:hypothetical protein